MKPANEELQRGFYVLNNRLYIFLKRVLTLTERPARRLLLIVLRPLLVRIRALKPLFRNFLILLLRWLNISISYYELQLIFFRLLPVRHYNVI